MNRSALKDDRPELSHETPLLQPFGQSCHTSTITGIQLGISCRLVRALQKMICLLFAGIIVSTCDTTKLLLFYRQELSIPVKSSCCASVTSPTSMQVDEKVRILRLGSASHWADMHFITLSLCKLPSSLMI